MALKFEAKDSTVTNVLFGNIKYRIPRYQRPYSWTEDQVSEFWNDLVTSTEPYFLGSFILNYESYDIEEIVDIIDGQQRMLTITIFMAVLRDIVKSIDPSYSRTIQNRDIIFSDRDDEFNDLRIQVGDSTKKYFERYIQNENENIISSKPTNAEEKRIRSNYIFFKEKIENEISKYLTNEDKKKFVKDIRKKVAELVVINIKIENEEEAYEIFETTNARGVDLSVADLLKNFIFKKIPALEDRDFAKDVWENITINIESTNTELKKFIRYFWISKYSFITEKKLFKEIKNNVTNWEKILGDLLSDASNFNKLLEGDENDYSGYKDAVKISESTFALRLMNVSQCYVLLLSILRNYEKLKTNPSRIFKLIENFTFQYSVVCKKPGNKVERIYSRYAILIEKVVDEIGDKDRSKEIQKIFSNLEKELIENAPSYDVFKESFHKIQYKNSENSRMLVKYILGKIDTYYRKTKEEKINFYQVNLEHILPQTPAKDWKLTKKEISPYVHKLGNLTLLSNKLNSKAQNTTIDKKIDHYRESELPITKQLVTMLEKEDFNWNEDLINKRLDDFVEISFKYVWKI